MPDAGKSLERRIEELEKDLSTLESRIEELEHRLERPAGKILRRDMPTPVAESGEPSEALLDWLGHSSLLQRLASICFLLVVALVLRTVTDNDILDKEVGSLIGMAYSFALIAWGWRSYRRSHSLAPVFTVCGAFLLYSIVVETHEHFESLPTVPAYMLIAAAGVALAFISHLYKVALPVFVGTLGMCLAGVALDFPHPVFPYLFILLLAANILGTFATRLQRCSWLRWLLFVVTVFMMMVWGMRLGIYLGRSTPEELPFSVAGFFPAVATLALVYAGIAMMGILGRINERVSRFDFALPTLNVLWAFAVARYAVNAGPGSGSFLGVLGVIAAAGHFAIGYWFGRRRMEGVPGTNSFALAGSILLALALPMATGSKLISLALISATAFGMAVLSRRWRSGGMRMTSYMLQFYACGILALLLRATETTSPSLVGAGASGALAGIAFLHYLWARNNPPPGESLVFARFDKDDRLAVFLLMASLLGGFFALRVGVYQAIVGLIPGEEISSVFSSAQTVIVNLSAAVLMCFAFMRRNKEVRNVAILVTIIGGVKVFMIDLFGLAGVPVVASVLSFGVAASLESFALSRWQRIDMLRVSKWPRKSQTGTGGANESMQ
jgi:hypothetical protein